MSSPAVVIDALSQNTESGSKRMTNPALGAGEPSPKKHKGRTPQAKNYSDEELAALVDLVSEHQPLGSEEWEVSKNKNFLFYRT